MNMKRSGFTLIEMLIVISIIGIVLTITGPRSGLVMDRSRDAALMVEVQNLRNAIHQFVLNSSGAFPKTIEELTPRYLSRVSPEWKGSRGHGTFHYDPDSGVLSLYSDGGAEPENSPDAKGKKYSEY